MADATPDDPMSVTHGIYQLVLRPSWSRPAPARRPSSQPLPKAPMRPSGPSCSGRPPHHASTDSGALTEEQLIAWTRTRLTGAKLPRTLRSAAERPTTASAKYRRRVT
ncbi:hypothetical protein GCM10009741_53500 [Kribbella lupini]|uniref:Uncharacterized protein n=1 Tax=Kribbella lupini TaxID=291602 RepID=A0ABN2BM63_9ACTN